MYVLNNTPIFVAEKYDRMINKAYIYIFHLDKF